MNVCQVLKHLEWNVLMEHLLYFLVFYYRIKMEKMKKKNSIFRAGSVMPNHLTRFTDGVVGAFLVTSNLWGVRFNSDSTYVVLPSSFVKLFILIH